MKPNLVDLILDKLNKIIREDCVGTEITDRTELFTASVYNDAKESYESKTRTEEEFKEAYEWSNDYLDKVYNSKTLADLIKNISPKIPYSLELKDNEVVFNWTCPNRIFGEFRFGFNIVYANIL